MSNKELLTGVWFGARSDDDDSSGRLKLVLLHDGTGVYDEDHNACDTVADIRWSVDNGRLIIEWFGKHAGSNFLCGEIEYSEGVEIMDGLWDRFIVDGYAFYKLTQYDTTEKIIEKIAVMRKCHAEHGWDGENKLHGFGFRNKKVASNVSKCADIFADERLMRIISKIAEQHADRFIWFYFSDANNEPSAGLVLHDTRTPNSGIDLDFNIWNSGTRDVTLIAYYKHDMDEPDTMDFLCSWNLDKVSVDNVACDIIRLIETYLTEDFTKLYEVKLSMRYEIMNREEARQATKDTGDYATAIISITDYGDERNTFYPQNWLKHILELQFNDLGDRDIGRHITVEQAEEIADFVLRVKDGVERIIVHCEFGQSRSAGVMAAIRTYFEDNDGGVFTNPKYFPNRTCYRYVLDALNKKGATGGK